MWWVAPAGLKSFRNVAPSGIFAEGRSLASVRASAETLTVVGIAPTGLLTVIIGNIGTFLLDGFAPPHVIDSSRTYFKPSDPVGVVVSPSGLDIVALGEEGWLWSVHADALTGALSAAEIVDTQVTLGEEGPLALVRHGQRLIALAVDSDSVLRSAHRDVGGT